MKRKFFSVLLLIAMAFSLFAGCNSSSASTETTSILYLNLSADEAKAIVLDALGVTAEEILGEQIHYGQYGDNNETAYSLMLSTSLADYIFIVSAEDGEILYRSDEAGQ